MYQHQPRVTLVAIVMLALACLLAGEAQAQTVLASSVRSTIVPLINATTEIDIDFINEIPRAMMWIMVQATNVTGVGSRPSIVDVALLFYPLNSLNSSSTLVMSAPMTFENNNDRAIRQTFATCSSVYAATLNRFVDVGTKLGRWTAVISRAQNAYQLTATLNVTIGAMAGQLSQSQSMYTGLVPSSIAFFDIANPNSNPQNLAVTITATQGNLSWLQLVSFRPQTCPVYTPFGVPDASQINVPLSTTNVSVTVMFANVTGDWHVAFETNGMSGQPFAISYIATDVIPPVVYEPFWDTENIVLAVLFGIGVLIMVVGLGVAIYWYNVRFSKREDYESL